MKNDFWECVWRELWRRKSHTVLHILSYVLAISVMLVLITWLEFSKKSEDEILAATGTHFIVFSVGKLPCFSAASLQFDPSEGFVAMGVDSKLFSAGYVESVRKLASVKDASPYLLFRFKDESDSHLFTVGGFDPSRPVSINSTSCAPKDIVSGRFITSEDKSAAMLEMDYAKLRGLKTGDDISIEGENFNVIGIVAPGVRPAKADIYMNISDAEWIINKRAPCSVKYTERVNIILVEVKSAMVQNEAMKEVKAIDQELTVSSFACYRPAAKVIELNAQTAWLFIIIIAIGLIVFSSQFQLSSVIERQHDIGILKAIGWSNNNIIKQILAESVMQSVIGGVLGCIAAALIISFMSMTISPKIAVLLLGLSIAGGVIAGFFSAMKISLRSPAETLRRL